MGTDVRHLYSYSKDQIDEKFSRFTNTKSMNMQISSISASISRKAVGAS